MPDESCRKCGGSLMTYSKCVGCNQINRFVCDFCGEKTIPRFHVLCMYGGKFYTSAEPDMLGNAVLA